MARKKLVTRPPLPVIHVRDGGNGEIRVWDFRSAEVGQFGVMKISEFKEMLRLLAKAGLLYRCIDHHDDCDGYSDECSCPHYV